MYMVLQGIVKNTMVRVQKTWKSHIYYGTEQLHIHFHTMVYIAKNAMVQKKSLINIMVLNNCMVIFI